MKNNLFNTDLLRVARHQVAKAAGDPVPELSTVLQQTKTGFTDAGAAAAGAGEMPMDPAAAMGGPIPPPMGDPAMAGGEGGGVGREEIGQMIQSAIAATGGAGEGAMGGAEPVKPKVDVNVVMLQILKILAKIADHLNISIPAADMVPTSPELTDMANQTEQTGAVDIGGAGGGSAISPIDALQGASPELAGMGGAGGGKLAGDRGVAAPQPRPIEMASQAGAMAAILRKAGTSAS